MLAVRLLLMGSLLCAVPALVSGCKSTESASPGTSVTVGDVVPPLSKTAHDGQSIDLRNLGKPAVVYFYPKDETPGCTVEACAFRDTWDRFQAGGVLVIGVSADTEASHRDFAKEHQLPFPLIADPQLEWAQAFGVETTLGMTHRVSFLVDAHGKIAKVYPKVDPGAHADEILQDAALLGGR